MSTISGRSKRSCLKWAMPFFAGDYIANAPFMDKPASGSAGSSIRLG